MPHKIVMRATCGSLQTPALNNNHCYLILFIFIDQYALKILLKTSLVEKCILKLKLILIVSANINFEGAISFQRL